MRKVEICLSPELIHLYDPEGKIVVIVDIFRASSTMIAALASGVKGILPVMDLETCRSFKEKGYTIAGERDGKKAHGFELGNSPVAYLQGNYSGKTVAITTTNGTLAIEKTKNGAHAVLVGAFVNLSATANHIQQENKDVLIVCAGWKGKFNLEDSLYAGALASKLHPHLGTDCDSSVAMKSLYESNQHRLQLFLGQASHAKRLQNHGIEKDIDFCLEIDKYNFIAKLQGNEISILKP
jgi:2-phosphosulfolactate phosphatase